jgi:UDP-N-acetylmuramoyl-tripeptide--D-alanyl-D-alanine ligase
VAVLGAMAELGSETVTAHRNLGERLRGARLSAVLLFGAEMRDAWEALRGSAQAARCQWLEDLSALGDALSALLVPGDLVLLKGSRSLAMERLLPRIAPADASDREGARC